MSNTSGPTGAVRQRRARREAEIITAASELIDQRGTRDLRIGDLAAAAGLNRTILYRHFKGQEEIYALTVVGHLEDLLVDMAAARRAATGPEEQVVALTEAFMDFGLARRGFVDVAVNLMGRTSDQLFEDMSEENILLLGRAMSDCLGELAQALDQGTADGVFAVEDSYLLANTLYAMGLGALQLAWVGIAVRANGEHAPRVGDVTAEHVRQTQVRTALALARHPRPD